MANKKISEFDKATSVDGTELVPIVQSGTNKSVTLNKITAKAADKSIDVSTSGVKVNKGKSLELKDDKLEVKPADKSLAVDTDGLKVNKGKGLGITDDKLVVKDADKSVAIDDTGVKVNKGDSLELKNDKLEVKPSDKSLVVETDGVKVNKGKSLEIKEDKLEVKPADKSLAIDTDGIKVNKGDTLKIADDKLEVNHGEGLEVNATTKKLDTKILSIVTALPTSGNTSYIYVLKTASSKYEQATGTYVAGTTYYTGATGGIEVDTTSFVEGTTDVSSYYVKVDTTTYASYEWIDGKWVKVSSDDKDLFINVDTLPTTNIDKNAIYILKTVATVKNYTKATGTYVSGQSYFYDIKGEKPVSTSGFDATTNVSSYYTTPYTDVEETTYTPYYYNTKADEFAKLGGAGGDASDLNGADGVAINYSTGIISLNYRTVPESQQVSNDDVDEIFGTEADTTVLDDLKTAIVSFQQQIDLKQDKLTAGDNVTITNNVVAVDLDGKQNVLVPGDNITINGSTISADLSSKQDKLTAGDGITISANNVIATDVIKDDAAKTVTAKTYSVKKINDELDKKQDKLTAGSGISISGSTISAKEWYGTQAQYNALSSKDSTTTYYIYES